MANVVFGNKFLMLCLKTFTGFKKFGICTFDIKSIISQYCDFVNIRDPNLPVACF